MFSSFKKFYRRHRRKLIAGGVAAGSVLAAKYAWNKYEEWQMSKVEAAQREARKQFHYESHQKTCTTTFVSFLPNIRNTIMEKLNTEELLEILKLRPANKLELWDQLKTLALSRVMCGVVADVLLLVVLKVKMNIIGAYLYARMSTNSDAKSTDYDITTGIHPRTSSTSFRTLDNDPVLTDEESNTEEEDDEIKSLQFRYLNTIRYFVEDRLPVLMDDCHDVVQHKLAKVTLKDKLSHEQLKDICMDALTQMKSKYTALNDSKHEFCTYIVDPVWRECEDNSDVFSRLMNDTTNVLESIDCSLVLDKCLQCGLDQALDNFQSSFRTTVVPEGEVSLDDCLTKDFLSNQLHMAKIIPILNSQIHEIFKVGSNKFLDVLFSQNELRVMSKNVYESTINEYSMM